MTKATHVLFFATRFGYSVAAYDDEGQPVETYQAGNHPGDSQGYLTPKKRYEPGEVHPVAKHTLKKWAKREAAEMAVKYNIAKDRVSYDHDSEQDETETLSAEIF